MHCKNCNIEISCKTLICPLCHEKLTNRTEEPLAFPTKQQNKHVHTHFTVETIYLFVSLFLFIIAVTVNYLTPHTLLWCYIVGLALFYGYFIIKHTIFSHFSVSIKIFSQVFISLLLMFFIQLIVGTGAWLLTYVLPAIISVSIIVQAFFIIFQAKACRANFFSAVLISLLGYIPITLWACGVTLLLWPQLTCALIASVCIIGDLTFGLTDIGEEFMKKFHF